MKTLVLAADTADARKAIAGAGLRKAKCSIIASWHDLRGRGTGGQPRIITSSFWERPDALKIHDALEVADKDSSLGVVQHGIPCLRADRASAFLPAARSPDSART